MEITLKNSKSFKYIIGTATHTFKSLKIIYIIEAIILLIGLFSNHFFSQFTKSLDLIPTVATLLTMNFVAHLIVFSLQVSKDHGKLLFLTPVKGIEFILGHFLELLLVDSFIIVVTSFVGSINSHSIASTLITSSLGILLGLLSAHLLLTGTIAIVSCYIRSTGLCILGVILCCSIGESIYSWINNTIISFLPYFYLSIGKLGIIEIDIFSVVIDIIALVGLQIVAAYMIDKKLDIL